MIVLPFPHKALWPNGRAHYMTKAREVKKHREWARLATMAALPRCFKWSGERIKLRVTITPKTAHAIDRDNCVAALKSYIDGIADALGVNDSAFAVPEIVFAKPVKPGGVQVVINPVDSSLDPAVSGESRAIEESERAGATNATPALNINASEER